MLLSQNPRKASLVVVDSIFRLSGGGERGLPDRLADIACDKN